MNAQKINTIAPILRMLLGDGALSPIVRFTETKPQHCLNISIQTDKAEEIVQQIKQAVPEDIVSTRVVSIEGAGCFQILPWPKGQGGRIEGKIAVVTGSAQGFGLEIAQGLAAEGAAVVLAGYQ